MSQRFVIDINVNGASSPTSTQEKETNTPNLNSKQSKQLLEKYGQLGQVSQGKYFDLQTARLKKQGMFRDTYEVQGLEETGDELQDITKQISLSKINSNQVKSLGVATAWKTAGSALELMSYTSGDSAANKQRAMGMKMATYGATILATGGNPLVIAGIIGNELISAGADAYKYSHDRKMERGQIMNMANVAGDISYGRRRGGR